MRDVLPEVKSLWAYSVGMDTTDMKWRVRGEGVTGYEVQYSVAGEAWRPVEPAHDGLEQIYRHEDVIPGQQYYYRVRARTPDGMGEWSDVVSPTTSGYRYYRWGCWIIFGFVLVVIGILILSLVLGTL